MLFGWVFFEWSHYNKVWSHQTDKANAYANRQGWMLHQLLVLPTLSESKPDWGEIDLIGCSAPALPRAAHASICSVCIVIRSSWCRTDRTYSQVLIPTHEVSAVLDCSLGSPGRGRGSWGWSPLAWHCTVRTRETLCSVWFGRCKQQCFSRWGNSSLVRKYWRYEFYVICSRELNQGRHLLMEAIHLVGAALLWASEIFIYLVIDNCTLTVAEHWFHTSQLKSIL